MAETFGQKLVKRLGAFAKALEKNQKISERFTCRRVELKLDPRPYDPQSVRKTRELLKLSQALFAQFLGVSVKTVSAWERGDKAPSEMACRFMDEIQKNPDFWRNRLRESFVCRDERHCVG